MSPVRMFGTCIGLAALAGAAAATPPQILPDLAIVDAQFAAANPDRLRIRVANLGLAPAVESRIELTYWQGGAKTTMSAAVPRLLAGERQWLAMVVGMLPAEVDAVLLRIDEPSVIIESDEENNVYVYSR